MRNMYKKIISFLMLATMAGTMTLTACNGGGNSGSQTSSSSVEEQAKEIEIWSTYNTQKVLRDAHNYDDIKMDAAIKLTMAQGEYEGAQLIITPDMDISYYNVSVSDLTHVETGATFDSERIKIYKQEYMYLGAIFQAVDGNVAGYYPDALIPMDAVVAYEENQIAAGDNQGIYFRFSTRPELDKNGNPIVKEGAENETEDSKRYTYVPVGTYTGTVTLDFVTEKKTVPITLTVVDATVSETAHTKSYMGTYRTGFAANLNYTQEGVEQWNDTLLDYRMSGSNVLNDYTPSDKSLEAYVDAMWKYISNPRCSAWTLDHDGAKYEEIFDSTSNNFAWTKEQYLAKFDANYDFYRKTFHTEGWADEYRYQFVKTDENGNEYAYDPTLEGQDAFDVIYFEQQVWMFIQKCIEEDMNVLHKLRPSSSLIDEPWQHNRHEKVRAVMTLYRAALIDIAEKLTATETPSMAINGETVTLDFSDASNFTKEEMVDTVLGMKYVVTADYLASFEGLIEYWCPTSDYFGSAYARENYYGTQDEKWWYPVDDAPGITYTIESSMLYARIPGWMMADYDITGLLYWSYSGFYERDPSTGTRGPIDDYFTTNYLRYPNSNGNGYLMYPGGQYELDEMIPSLRLEAIRDGLEEFELMYNIKQTYQSISSRIGEEFDASKIIESLGSSLYAEDKIVNDNANFAAARESLLQLASCADSAANLCVVDYSDDTYGKQNFKIYANDGVDVYNNGELLTDVYKNIEGVGKIYNVNVALVNDTNSLNITFKCGNVSHKYTQLCGGKASVFDVGAFNAANFMESTDIPFSAQQVDCATEGIFTEIGGSAIKLSIGASQESVSDALQYFRFTSDIFKTEFAGSKKIMIHLYNASETEINLTLEYKKHNSYELSKLFTTPLTPGENCLTITLPSGDWNEDYLEYFDFGVGEGESAKVAKVLYIKDVVVYKE